MTTFDVRIDSTENPALRLLVAADTWVSAWREALTALGDPTLPIDAACTVASDHVQVEVPSLRRLFTIWPADPNEALPEPTPGSPLMIAEDGSAMTINVAAAQPPRRHKTSVGSPPARRDRGLRTPTTAPDLDRRVDLELPPRRPVKAQVRSQGLSARVRDVDPATPPSATASHSKQDDSTTESDPIARVLSDLQRQRLLARPVRISAKTGLPSPIEPTSGPTRLPPSNAAPATPKSHTPRLYQADRRARADLPKLDLEAPPWSANVTADASGHKPERTRARRNATPTGVPRPGDTTVPALARASEARENLPQQFRPVQLTATPPSGDGLLIWAADAAWQSVPSSLTLVLSEDPQDALTVVAARGQHEREAQGCRLVREGSKSQLLCRVANRIRYSEPARLRFAHPDGRTWDVFVDSALCVPVPTAAHGPGPGASGGKHGGPHHLSLLLLNAPRASGFTDGEASSLAYLAHTIATHLND
jgi:hypothetical protein